MDGQREGDQEGGNLPPDTLIPEVDDGQQFLTTEEEVFVLAGEVFGIDLIRDIIVDHAIHQADECLDVSTICALRGLGIAWNDSVCRLLHKNNDSLYYIYLGDENRLNGRIRNEGTAAEFLSQFTKTFACSSRVLGCSPTFSLRVNQTAFQPDCYKFLIGCGEGLVWIGLSVPWNPRSMKGIFPNLSLPALHSVNFDFDDPSFGGQDDCDNTIHLLQSILSGARRLKEVEIWQYEPCQPSLFKLIVLPQSVTEVDLQLEFNSEDVEMLVLKNPLPNLKSLTFSISDDLVTTGLLSRILEKFRLTIKTLTLEKDIDGVHPENTVLARFPVMERLEFFSTFSERFAPESSGLHSLERFLPKLRTLVFFDQRYDVLRKWTNVLRSFSVQEIKISAVEQNLSLDSE